MTNAIAILAIGCFGICVLMLLDASLPMIRRRWEDWRAARYQAARFEQMADLVRRRDE